MILSQIQNQDFESDTEPWFWARYRTMILSQIQKLKFSKIQKLNFPRYKTLIFTNRGEPWFLFRYRSLIIYSDIETKFTQIQNHDFLLIVENLDWIYSNKESWFLLILENLDFYSDKPTWVLLKYKNSILLKYRILIFKSDTET